MKNSMTGDGCLIFTSIALIDLSGLYKTKRRVTTCLTYVAVGPFCFFQGLYTLFLSAISVHELRNTQTLMKMNYIFGHDNYPDTGGNFRREFKWI